VRGIISYGAYVPPHRLKREAIEAALRTKIGSGTRSVASYDQDTTTLGVEAARLALDQTGEAVARLLFATASPAYLDKTNATALHAALELGPSVLALDSGGALRSGLGSLLTALQGGPTSLVVLSDMRGGRPGSDEESAGGDAAAAFVVGDGKNVLAEFCGSGSITDEFMDRWRLPGEKTAQVWEERFGETVYAGLVEKALSNTLDDLGLAHADLARIVVTGVHGRAVKAAQRRLGSTVVSDLTEAIGQTGAAHSGVLLTVALAGAKPGDRIAVVSLADGVDVAVFKATSAIERYWPQRPLASQLNGQIFDVDYPTFLGWRGFLDRQPPRRPDLVRPAAPPSFRNRGWKFGLAGSEDRSSHAVHLPPQRVSFVGEAVDDMTSAPRADAYGTIATFSIDRLAYTPSPPMIVAVIDFDAGGRFIAELTDAKPDEVAIGMRVEMTFRRFYTAGGIHNYFWKARPVRVDEER